MKKLIYLAAAALTLSSCESFLDTESYTKKNTSNYPTSLGDAQQVITGIYTTLNKATSDAQNCHFYMSELASDERFGGGGENDKDMQGLDHLMNTKTSRFETFWTARFQGVFRANMAIETLDNCTGWESPEQRNQFMGEAYYLRAMFYFELSQMFGEVPLVLTTTSQNLPKSPAEATYAQITADLKQAIDLLPAKPYHTVLSGHATKWAAEALMARVYLFYTGYYQKDALPMAAEGTVSSVSKDQVITWLQDCIANSGHSLASDFRNLWPYSNEYTAKDYPYVKENNLKWEGDGNKETVFAVKYSNLADWSIVTGYANQNVLHFGLRGPNGEENTFPFGAGWGAGPVNSKLWNEWKQAEPNDIRRVGSILDAPTEFSSYVWGADKQMEETGFWQKKYIPVRAKDETGKLYQSYSVPMFGSKDEMGLVHTQDLVVIRFADVLLMLSELKQDAAGINQVRARAGLPSIAAYSLDALKKERRFELAFEGVRWFDLMRWGDAATALDKQLGITIKNKNVETVMKGFGGGYTARYNATGGFWPIPESQIALSEGVLEQNKGWGTPDAEYPGW